MKKCYRFFHCALLLLAFIPALSSAQDPSATSIKENKHVVLLLWRGVTDAERGFMDDLAKSGNIRFTILDANRDKAQLKQYIHHIDQYHPDLIYSFGTTITRELLGSYDNPSVFSRTHNIPVVFNIVTDPIGSKIVSSDNNQPRNFTGVSHIVPLPVQLKAIAQLRGKRSVGVLYTPSEYNSLLTAKKLAEIAAKSPIQVQLYPLSASNGQPSLALVDSNISKMRKDGIELAYLPPDSYIIANGKHIVESLRNVNIPAFSATEAPIRKYKALFGVVSRYYNTGQFAAYKAEQILNDKKKAHEIPVEALSQYSYIVNMNAAQTLNYYPPVSILKISELVGRVH